ncbi:MAG: hypothetical protein JWP85_2456 [Rhodoglobus sp.]|nr:hypothetical protein [Rhodoglobus sp.]
MRVVLARALPWVGVAASAASGVLALAGLSAWVVAGVAAALWLGVIARRLGAGLGIPLALLGVASTITVVLLLTAAAGLPINESLGIVFAALGVAGGILLARRTSAPRGHASFEPAVWIPSLTGALVWIVSQAVTLRLPVYEMLSWVMRNDMVNTLVYAHDVLYRTGITPGPRENPAPLPAALVAVSMAPGRSSVPGDAVLLHDLVAIAVTWGALISLTCVLAGIVAGSLARSTNAPRWMVVVASAVGSLVVLSWYFTGYPIEYGFINAHVSLVVLLAAVLVYLYSSEAPAIGMLGLCIAAAVMLTVWSPLVVIPLGLAAALMAWHWRELLRTRGRNLAAVIAGIVLLGVAVVVIALPPFFSQREALAGAGGIYRPDTWIVFALVAAVGAGAFVLARKRSMRLFAGMSGVVISILAGLGFLLFISRRSADPWTYYPVKFAWLASLLLIVLAVGLAVALIGSYWRRVLAARLGIAALAAVVATLMVWSPDLRPALITMNPVDRLFRSQEVETFPLITKSVLELSRPDQPVLLWESAPYRDVGEHIEGEANIWLVQLWTDSLREENIDVRLLGLQSYSDKSPELLCRIAVLMGPGLVVHTARDDLEASVDRQCPTNTITFVVEG